MDTKKTANLLKLLTGPLAKGVATSAAFDAMTYGHGQDSVYDLPRAINFGKNIIISTPGFGAADALKGIDKPMAQVGSKLLTSASVLSPVATNLGVEQAALTAAQRRELNTSIWDRLNNLSPIQKALVAGGGLTAGALAIPALINISRAAKRLADGRSIRLSTSLRKRRNEDKDLVIGVKSVEGEDAPENPVDQ